MVSEQVKIPGKLICLRLPQGVHFSEIKERWESLGFENQSQYLRALIRADLTARAPALSVVRGIDREACGS